MSQSRAMSAFLEVREGTVACGGVRTVGWWTSGGGYRICCCPMTVVIQGGSLLLVPVGLGVYFLLVSSLGFLWAKVRNNNKAGDIM